MSYILLLLPFFSQTSSTTLPKAPTEALKYEFNIYYATLSFWNHATHFTKLVYPSKLSSTPITYGTHFFLNP